MPVRRSDVSILFGSTTLDLVTKRDELGLKAWVKHRGRVLTDLATPFVRFPHFSYGAGAEVHRPGYYQIGLNADCRFGNFQPGLREVVDLTGIAANFRVRKIIKHLGINTALTTDGTDTRIYRVETTWVLKATQAAAVGTDIVSFKGVLGVAFGAGAAYRFTSETANGASAWTLTASTKSGNADEANYFTVVSQAKAEPVLWYVRNNTDIFYATDVNNAGSVSTFQTVGDNDTRDFFTSLTVDSAGNLIIGRRYSLYTINNLGEVSQIGRSFPAENTDAGGQGDRNNFEAYTPLNGRIYYITGGGRVLLEYGPGIWNEFMAPGDMVDNIPRMQLPMNAITTAGQYIVLLMGTNQFSTLFDITQAPGGSATIANSSTAVSEMWAGRYQVVNEQKVLVWHGILLVCTNLCRGMFFDGATDYLYLFSGDAELADLSMTRCIFPITNPLYKKTGSTVVLTTVNYELETGLIFGVDQNGEDADMLVKEFRQIEATTIGLASTTPSLEVLQRRAREDQNTAYASVVTWTSNATALAGTDFAAGLTGKGLRLKFIGTDNGSDAYAIMKSAILTIEGHPVQYDQIELVCYATSAKVRPTGARSSVSGKGIKDALDTWKTSDLVATLTDKQTGDTYSVKLVNYQLKGQGARQELLLSLAEAV